VTRLSDLLRALGELRVADDFVLDPSITRGLDYYTGIVFETFLNDVPDIGSVCSGGRYNDLASLYTRQSIPGVGASIGLDRLMAAMEELGIRSGAGAGSSVLVLLLDPALTGRYHAFARAFRDAGISAEVYPEQKKLAAQFAYAEKRGIPLALVCGGSEMEAGVVGLKDLRSRQSHDGLGLEAAIAKATELLR
jgi:histidyl-tRNA synthetase